MSFRTRPFLTAALVISLLIQMHIYFTLQEVAFFEQSENVA